LAFERDGVWCFGQDFKDNEHEERCDGFEVAQATDYRRERLSLSEVINHDMYIVIRLFI